MGSNISGLCVNDHTYDIVIFVKSDAPLSASRTAIDLFGRTLAAARLLALWELLDSDKHIVISRHRRASKKWGCRMDKLSEVKGSALAGTRHSWHGETVMCAPHILEKKTAPSFVVLGPLRIFTPQGEVDPGPRQRAAILLILLVHLNEFVSVNYMIESLWGESPPCSALNTVHRHLGRIRRFLDEVKPAADGLSLSRRHSQYCLIADSLELDLGRFRHLTHQASVALSGQERWAHLDQALRLWQGDVGAGLTFTDPFARDIRSIEGEFVSAVIMAVDVGVTPCPSARLLHVIEKALETDPWNETLLGRMISLLNRLGRPRDALLRYASYRRELADELGIDPGPELQAAFAEVLAASAKSSDLPRAARQRPRRDHHSLAAHHIPLERAYPAILVLHVE
jgi:DNA-binding SARP family transcriptional activator